MSSIASIVVDKYTREANGEPAAAPVVAKAPKVSKLSPAPLTEAQRQEKEAMKNALKVGIWVVEFTKVDGTQAVMECTLDSKYLPAGPTTINPVAPTTGAAAAAEHLLHVYATDRLGWRSFTVANVKKFYKLPEAL